MRNSLVFIVIFSFGFLYSQKAVSISLHGFVKNYSTKENIFGSTIHLQQNNKLISRAVSESNGTYVISGKINISSPFEVISSKSGFITKKISVDLKTLVVNNATSSSVELLPEFTFQLYEKRPNIDLSFATQGYAELFTWSQESYNLVPFGKEKELSEKVESAYNNLQLKVKLTAADSLQKIQNDATIELTIKTILSQAAAFTKAGKYADALAEYSKVQGLSANVFDEKRFSKYRSTAETGIQDVKVKKDAEELAFKGQIKLAKDKIAQGRLGLNTASSVLNSEPMKSRSSDPEVILLKDQISKLQQYYKEKTAAYKLLKSKKNSSAALTALQNVFTIATANSDFTVASEISQLKKSIDSLNGILNPSLNQTLSTNNQPSTLNKLKSPGKRFNGNPKDAFNNLDKTATMISVSQQDQMEIALNAVNYENSMNKKLDEARSIEAASEVNKWKDEKDKLSLKEDSLSELRQYQMEETRLKNEYENYKLDSLSLEKTYIQAQQLQELQIKNEVHDFMEKERLALTHQSQKEMVDQHVDQLQLQQLAEVDRQRNRQSSMEGVKNDVETAIHRDNLEDRKKEEQRMYDLQKKADEKVVLKNQPNFLADSEGNIYKSDSTYEEVYELKNEQGFVETVIIRRIIVDHYGYGVVYEQTKNASGALSYTKSGIPITEFEWQNQTQVKSPFKK